MPTTTVPGSRSSPSNTGVSLVVAVTTASAPETAAVGESTALASRPRSRRSFAHASRVDGE
jgi:hypothetical protein